MKLRRIKLSGFKSFVDPTSIELPGQLIGIVGPNGCGKSNVVDALRWVLGESSARQLRGDSMLDVIFNGSQSRAPVGKAQVELRFENTAGRIPGPFAAYAEIDVKRELARDGISHYRINQTRCRRRDVNDLFLGTGLGPRAYALIEQGMIARIIEARPEELRNFLEEASGVSRYKERRRETAQRIEQTRENLARVEDLRQELGAQLKRLEKQADTAHRFRALKAEERLWQAARLERRLETLEADMTAQRAEIAVLRLQRDENLAQLRAAESETVRHAETLRQAQDALGDIQGRYYAGAADLARLEQELRHAQQEAQRLASEEETLERESGQARAQSQVLEAAVRQAAAQLDSVQKRLTALREEEKSARLALSRSEETLAGAERALQMREHEAHGFRREAQVQGARLEQLRLRVQDQHGRRKRLWEEWARPAPNQAVSAEEQQRLEQASALLSASREEYDALQSRRQSLKLELAQAEDAFDHVRETYQMLHAQVQAWDRQLASISETGEDVSVLLGQLTAQPRSLLDLLSVEAGWEQAVEVALRGRLRAWIVSSLEERDLPQNWLKRQEKGRFMLLELEAHGLLTPDDSGRQALIDRTHWRGEGAHPLRSWLHGIYCAAELGQALRDRRRLCPGEFWVTADGALVGRNSLEWEREEEHDGVLQQHAELARLRAHLADRETALAAAKNKRDALRAEFEQVDHAVQRVAAAMQGHQREESRLLAERVRREAEQAAYQRRRAQIAEELESLDTELAALEEKIQDAERARQAADSRIRDLEEEIQVAQSARQRLRDDLQAVRAQFSRLREAVHQAELQRQGHDAERHGKSSAHAQLLRAGAQTEERLRIVRETLVAKRNAVPRLEEELQGLLQARETLEAELLAARNAYDALESRHRQCDETRLQAQHAIDHGRQLLQNAELRFSANAAKAEELHAQMQALTPYLQPDDSGKISPEDIRHHAAAMETEAIDAHLAQLGRRIDGLGNVNLAAIDEQRQVTERKTYLDAQCNDLVSALETLESAIRRMDKETRDRFKQTFDAVNANFQTLFPRLFGGGQAHLGLSDDNLLEAGVQVVARPPGKRNSSIHLLSGGEKALTAVALVFAIFRLNPAPFCVLDEVDAPLDEANVGRFCDMVREMSADTQFVFITHNKVTMQLADHLIGVTMAEPGASRIVSVDIDEAGRLAGAA